MQIVIDIPEDIEYNHLSDLVWINLKKCIQNSTLLPKGHGRLIDADQLLKEAHDIVVPVYPDGHEYRYYCVCAHSIYEAPTIIKADKEDQNADSN